MVPGLKKLNHSNMIMERGITDTSLLQREEGNLERGGVRPSPSMLFAGCVALDKSCNAFYVSSISVEYQQCGLSFADARNSEMMPVLEELPVQQKRLPVYELSLHFLQL